MKQSELTALLDTLIDAWESESVEFKEAGNDYKTDKIGSYFSALAKTGLPRSSLMELLITLTRMPCKKHVSRLHKNMQTDFPARRLWVGP